MFPRPVKSSPVSSKPVEGTPPSPAGRRSKVQAGPGQKTIGQRHRAGNYVAAHVPGRLRPHMFKVAPFASSPDNPFQSAPTGVQGLDAQLNVLNRMQAYYKRQRANAPAGTTTPQVQPEDWKLLQHLVNGMKADDRFAMLSTGVGNGIEALSLVLDQPGQKRYSALTALFRALEENAQAASRAQPAPKAAPAPAPAPAAARPPRQQQVSVPLAPQRHPASVPIDAALQDLVRLRNDTTEVNGRQQIDWSAVRTHVNSIVASTDFKVRFDAKQQKAFRDLQALNATKAGQRGRFDAWGAVQKLLPRDTRPPRNLQNLRGLLDRLIASKVWLDSDTTALSKLCCAEKHNSDIWGAQVSHAMWLVQSALDSSEKVNNTGALMASLLFLLDQQFPRV